MTKKNFMKSVTNLFNERSGLAFTPVLVEEFLECVADVIADALKTDGKITIKNLLSVYLIDHGDNKRRAWDPFRKEYMEYTPGKSIHCRFSKSIRDAINENNDSSVGDIITK